MKRPLPTCLLLIVAMMSSLVLHAKDSTEAHIDVSAKAERRVTADRAEFQFTVQGLAESLGEAVEAATRGTDSVVLKLIALGVRKEQISTRQFTSGENRGGKAFLSSSKDFRAHIITRVVIDSLPLLAMAVTIVSEAGVMDIGNVTFSLRDELAVRREVRKAATRLAREKAEDIATELGTKLSRVLFAGEPSTAFSSFGSEYGNATGGIMRSTIRHTDIGTDGYVPVASFNTQEILVSAQITLRYAIR